MCPLKQSDAIEQHYRSAETELFCELAVAKEVCVCMCNMIGNRTFLSIYHTQQADGQDREAKFAAKEAEFEQFCAERTRALEEREAAAVELEARLKQQAHTQQGLITHHFVLAVGLEGG